MSDATPPSSLRVTQALALWETRNMAQERALSKQWQPPFPYTQRSDAFLLAGICRWHSKMPENLIKIS